MKKSWLERQRIAMMSSFFALAMGATSLFGGETQENAIKPEVRSSATEMVQTGAMGQAASKLDAQVREDGGEVEAPSTGSQVIDDVNSAADTVYSAGSTARNFLTEKGEEYLGAFGRGLGTLLGSGVEVVTGTAGLLTQGAGYVAGGATDAGIALNKHVLQPTGDYVAQTARDGYETVSNAVSDGYDYVADGVTQGYEAVRDAVTPSAETETAEAAPAAETPAPEMAEGAPAPAPEVAPQRTTGDDVRADVNAAAQDVYQAGRTADNYLRENLGQGAGSVLGGIAQTGTGLAGLATEGSAQVAGAAVDLHNTMNDNVYQPVAEAAERVGQRIDEAIPTRAEVSQTLNNVGQRINDAIPTREEVSQTFNNIGQRIDDAIPTREEVGAFVDRLNPFSRAEAAPQTAAAEQQAPAPEVTPAQAAPQTAEAAPAPEAQATEQAATPNWFERNIIEPVKDAHETLNNNIYVPVANAAKDGYNYVADGVAQGYEAVRDAVTPNAEAAPQTAAAEQQAPAPEVTPAQAAPAPAAQTQTAQNAPNAGPTWLEQGFNATVDAVKDAHNYMDENVYQPTGKVLKETITVAGDKANEAYQWAQKQMTPNAQETQAPQAAPQAPQAAPATTAATQEAPAPEAAKTEQASQAKTALGKAGEFVMNDIPNAIKDGYDKYVPTKEQVSETVDKLIPTKEETKSFFAKLNPMNWGKKEQAAPTAQEAPAPQVAAAETAPQAAPATTAATQEAPAPEAAKTEQASQAKTALGKAGEFVMNDIPNAIKDGYDKYVPTKEQVSETVDKLIPTKEETKSFFAKLNPMNWGKKEQAAPTAQEAPAPQVAAAETAPQAAEAAPAPEAQATEQTAKPNWFERNVVEPAKEAHAYMDEHVYQPTGKMVGDTVKDIGNKIDEVIPTKEQVTQTLDNVANKIDEAIPTKEQVGQAMDKINPFKEETKTANAQEAASQAPADRFAQMLKEKGFSDDEIKQAVGLAREAYGSPEKTAEVQHKTGSLKQTLSEAQEKAEPVTDRAPAAKEAGSEIASYKYTGNDAGVNITVNGLLRGQGR